MENQRDNELDLIALFGYLKKKIAVIIAVSAVFALVACVISAFFIVPKYEASTRVYVLNRLNDESLGTSDFSISNYILKDYASLITGRNVTRNVIDKMGLPMSNGTLAKMIRVSALEGTRMLQISITDTDPQRAADIANCVREEAVIQLQQITAADAVNLVYEAEVPMAPSSPNVSKNTLAWGAIGFAVAIAALSVIFMVNDAIRTEDDVERYLGIGTLGIIPLSEDLNSDRKSAGRRRVGFAVKEGLKWKK